jgi:serine protease Do
MELKARHLFIAMAATAIFSIGATYGLVTWTMEPGERLEAAASDHEHANDGQVGRRPVRVSGRATGSSGSSRSADFDSPRSGTTGTQPAKAVTASEAARAAASSGANFVKLAEALKPTVVHISTSKDFTSSPLYHWLPHGRRKATGLGTGTIIDSDGLILTNNHVIRSADVIMVRLADERIFRAQVVGRDEDTDLALIEIEAKKPLPHAKLGDSDELRIGERVVAIGNPFGLDHTVTAGIVSAKGRRNIAPGGRRSPYWDFIQTDASINPGNSGGPLINMRGEVVGVNTAIDSRGAGIGFAIPVNMAKAIIPLLKKHGRAPRSYLGVTIQPVTRSLKRSLSLPSRQGALVAQVVPGSPAQKAGIMAGDVIVEFNGKKVEKSSDLPWLAAMAGIGKKVDVVVIRGGKRYKIEATLEAKDPRDAVGGEKGSSRQMLGLTARPVTPELARAYGLSSTVGLIVTRVEQSSPAARAGLVRGEVILQVGPRNVTSLSQMSRELDRYRRGQDVPLLVTSPRGTRWVIVPKL